MGGEGTYGKHRVPQPAPSAPIEKEPRRSGASGEFVAGAMISGVAGQPVYVPPNGQDSGGQRVIVALADYVGAIVAEVA